MTTTNADSEPSQPLGLALTEGLGLAPERDEVLRQLDDRTNQTWAGKRARWAALVRAQDAEIQRLRAEVAAKDARIDAILRGNRQREAELRSYIR